MLACALCHRTFANRANLEYHLAERGRCTVVVGRLDAVQRNGNPAIGNNKAPTPIVALGRNFRCHVVGRAYPSPSSAAKAWEWVCAIGAGRTLDIGPSYQRSTVSVDECSALLSCLYGRDVSLPTVLRTWGVVQLRNSAIHLYHTTPNPEEIGQTGHPHCDPHEVVFVQLVGRKILKMGGVLRTETGQGGNSLNLTPQQEVAFLQSCNEKTLVPGNVVGFGKRQIHCLAALDPHNASMSITVTTTSK